MCDRACENKKKCVIWFVLRESFRVHSQCHSSATTEVQSILTQPCGITISPPENVPCSSPTESPIWNELLSSTDTPKSHSMISIVFGCAELHFLHALYLWKNFLYICALKRCYRSLYSNIHTHGFFVCGSVCMCRSDCSAPVRTIIRSDQSYCKAVQCNCEFECECAQFYLRLSFERSPAGLSMYWSVCTMCVMWKRQNSTLTVTVEQQQRQHHHQKRKKERAKL